MATSETNLQSFAQAFNDTQTPSGRLAVWHLGQAGFCFKTHAGTKLALDAYLTNCVERVVGFKRMQPPVTSPGELGVDILMSTHSHLDHLDIDALPCFAANPETIFVGAPDCEPIYKAAGIPASRLRILCDGESAVVRDVTIRAVHADHGELAPDAVGFLIEVDGLAVYNVGDSGYCPERVRISLGQVKIGAMIAPINGAFGNLNAIEACALAASIRPKTLIGCHFWMFVEQGGDPAAFLAESKRLGINGIVMAPGENLIL